VVVGEGGVALRRHPPEGIQPVVPTATPPCPGLGFCSFLFRLHLLMKVDSHFYGLNSCSCWRSDIFFYFPIGQGATDNKWWGGRRDLADDDAGW